MSPIGREFKPKEPYTQRLRKILEEYPDGSQVLREILQNSDDAQSTEQIFTLDHNTYQSNKLFEPHLTNYKRTNLKLDRYQGPALLAKNTTIFKEEDFKSLLKLADSNKRNQFDKIGVMGVGFNSIYHITDSPSFITGDKYVILDPHERYFNGGVEFDFNQELTKEYPDQFSPFSIPCGKPFKGTIFRYPLRTNEDSNDSEISDKVYKPEEILDMFHKFYEKESINCLLFLKYIECISFYELKKGDTKPELLYMIRLENAEEVRQDRRLIGEKIGPMMSLLKSEELNGNSQLDTSYVASFYRQKGDSKETNSWLILNYLNDLLETEEYFQKKSKKNIGDYKFIPNVGLAVPLNNLNVTGRLFCFLPLPISMPFLVSVHGYFAVSTNRRSLWSPADNEDLAADALARLKVTWNEYLFEKVLPKAWAKFLRELPLKVPNIQPYKFWPIVKEDTSSSTGSINYFCKDLLQNVIENLDVEDRVFKGPSSSNTIGMVSISADSYDASSFKESEFHWLSLSNGYFEDERSFIFDLPRIIGNIGFPVITVPSGVIRALNISRYRDLLNFFSPAVVRDYLKRNRDRWDNNAISRKEVLQLFEYILTDKKFEELEGLKMIPLADGTLKDLTQSNNNSCVYIDDITNHRTYVINACDIFKDQLNKFIDKSIDNYGLYRCLYENAKARWGLNIKILDELAVANMIKFSINFAENANQEEIDMSNHHEWIYQLWENLRYKNWDLTEFEDIHLIPTSRFTLRKLKTPKKIFLNQTSEDLSTIFKKFGAVFVNDQFNEISRWNKISPYIIEPNDIITVLNSFRSDISYPGNVDHTLQGQEASALVEHLSNYLRLALAAKKNVGPNIIEVIKHLPIFTEVGNTTLIPLLPLFPENKRWHLLPQDEENSYETIIYPNDMGGFLNTSSKNLCYILEDIIKIPRLDINDYWRVYVVPFLESRQSDEIDIVIDKLFDRLPSLHANLKNDLGEISFVPAGTFKVSQLHHTPDDVKLVKPTDLFDPEESTVIDLFFDDEQVFPAGKYGIPQGSSSESTVKFFSNLKLLGMKSVLSPNDIISRINTIVTRRESSGVHKDLIHSKAVKLFKYIDENWDHLINNNQSILKAISEKEWIPTVDKSGNKFFSKPQNCYRQENKYLVSLVAQVVEFKVKNKRLLSHLGWDTYPRIEDILEQLDLCCVSVSSQEPPENLEKICSAIYNYMNEICDDASKASLKEYLKNKSWILCINTFHSIDKVVFDLPIRFQGNNSSIVELPIEYRSRFKKLFQFMGVRDEIEIKDLILIIKNDHENEDDELTMDEIRNIIQILRQIADMQKYNRREGNQLEKLDELLIPSNKNILKKLYEIQFDDMKDRIDDEEKDAYTIAHDLVTPDIARELEMQALTGKIYDPEDIDDWEIYEQNESLTTSIKNIIKDYPLNRLLKEFLQNADNAKATRFSVILDERKAFQHDPSKKSFFSEEMEGWQGPAIWIYNDAKFSKDDFQALINRIGRKSRDEDENENDTRFGIGFNCAFHITDLPSIVSGKYITFLDPHAKFLPVTGYPPRRRKGIRINFMERNFKRNFPDQCYPYEAIKGCNFTEKFKGTLFRIPLRTHNLGRQSEISNQVFDISEILKIFNNIQGNIEILFLRNIESYSLHYMTKKTSQQLIWQALINNLDTYCKTYRNTYRKIRKSMTDRVQVYQMDIEILKTNIQKKVSEIWLLCTGGHDRIKPEFKEFSKEKRLKPRGGVASLLARSDEKSLTELKSESFPNPPELKGEIFSNLPLSITSNLGVHLNGSFSLSSARSSIFHSDDNDSSQVDCSNTKWNKYILYDILPDLHAKLFEEIVKLEKARHAKIGSNFVPHTTKNFWPINKNLTMNLYKSYSLNVIKKLGLNECKIFWTNANGGQFVSLREARIFEVKYAIIADILVSSGVSAVKLDKNKIEQLSHVKSGDPTNFPYKPMSGKLVCEELHSVILSIPSFGYEDNNIAHKHTRNSLFKLLDYIVLRDESSFEDLNELPLVPLSNGSVGKFGDQTYYIGSQENLDLFPNSTFRFVSVDLPENLLKFFNNDKFSTFTKIKKFDSSAILDLLNDIIRSERELKWDPNENSISNKISNKAWLKIIWSKLNETTENLDFARLSRFPLLPVIQPFDILVQPDMTNPLLYIPENGHILFPVLVKLNVRFTDIVVPVNAHEDLKKCVVKCTPINIINSLERTCSSLDLTMKKMFESSNLSPSDYEVFRTFVKANLETLTEYGQGNFMEILKSLPIWPIHSIEENKFIDATSGNLLTNKLQFFSFHENTNFYKCDHGSDFNALSKLGITPICELNYLKDYITPPIIAENVGNCQFCPNGCFIRPSRSYITFLQSVLSLGDQEVENYLKNFQVIPSYLSLEDQENDEVESFVKADALYDTNVLLFRTIFDTDKALPSELQNNPVYLEALRRMGLNHQINCNTYIECAQEIMLQIQQRRKSINVIKDQAKNLIWHLYEHIDTLNFNDEQWSKILEIKFVPSETNIQSQFYQTPKETSGFETFITLCSQKYKKICWTQRPLFDESVEPTNFKSFFEQYPEIGIPSQEDIFNHWFFIVENISSWRSSSEGELKSVIKEIYEMMDGLLRKGNLRPIDGNDSKKLFLNGEDPFDRTSWLAGKKLVFCQQDNNEGIHKVKQFLMPYKDLLIFFGAQDLYLKPVPEIIIRDQKDFLLNSLLNKLVKKLDDEYHDVIFIVGGEEISANRYVLLAAGLSEFEIEVPTNIQPDTFRVFLRLLYGRSLEDVKKPDDYLSFLVNLLKIIDLYKVEQLKNKVQDTIIRNQYISIHNVCKILEFSKECDVQQLKSYYEDYVRSHKEFVNGQLLELREKAADYEERSKISKMSQMLGPLLSN